MIDMEKFEEYDNRKLYSIMYCEQVPNSSLYSSDTRWTERKYLQISWEVCNLVFVFDNEHIMFIKDRWGCFSTMTPIKMKDIKLPEILTNMILKKKIDSLTG